MVPSCRLAGSQEPVHWLRKQAWRMQRKRVGMLLVGPDEQNILFSVAELLPLWSRPCSKDIPLIDLIVKVLQPIANQDVSASELEP